MIPTLEDDVPETELDSDTSARRTYPWEKWQNGEWWSLTPGEDYPFPKKSDGSPADDQFQNMRTQLFVRAKSQDMFVTTKVRNGKLWFRFYTKMERADLFEPPAAGTT